MASHWLGPAVRDSRGWGGGSVELCIRDVVVVLARIFPLPLDTFPCAQYIVARYTIYLVVVGCQTRSLLSRLNSKTFALHRPKGWYVITNSQLLEYRIILAINTMNSSATSLLSLPFTLTLYTAHIIPDAGGLNFFSPPLDFLLYKGVYIEKLAELSIMLN